jgi:type IV secretion system protein VirB9
VSWSYPELVVIARDAPPSPAKPDEDARRRLGAAASDRRLPLERLNFAYTVHGQAPFRPAQVLDDGRFTYIRLPANLQEMPALFVLGESGEGELVNYTLRGGFLVVQRLADRFVLRLGRSEVTIARERSSAWPGIDGGLPTASGLFP